MKKQLLILLLALSACSSAVREDPADSPAACAETACAFDEQESLQTDLQTITFEQALEMMEQNESGAFYFHFENCPWCKALDPILDEVLQESPIPLYSVLVRDENNERLYSDEQKERMIPYLGEAMSENEEGELTLYVPLLALVDQGELVSWHVGTLEDHDATKDQLSQEQTEILQEQLVSFAEQAKEVLEKS